MAVKGSKKILALKRRKARDQERKFIVEGIRLVREAIDSDAPIEQLILDREAVSAGGEVQSILELAKRKEIEIQETDRRALKNMGEHQTPEGVIGVVRMAEWEREQVFETGSSFLLLDRVRDPGNLGLIQRTAEAAGVDAIFLSADSVELHNPKVVRASRGSIFRIPTLTSENLSEVISDLKTRGVQVIAAELSGTPYDRAPAMERFALLLGNETFGIDPSLLLSADASVTIPMANNVNSLNISVAAGILLFLLSSQKAQKKS